MQSQDKVILRKVDIVSWESEAFKQANAEFKMRSIPSFAVYDINGRLVGGGLPTSAVEGAVSKGLRP